MPLEMRIIKQLPHFVLDVALTCAPGELTAIVGPSGSGKTTTIRVLAGLERPDSGFIRLGDRLLCDIAGRTWLPTRKRRLGYVFQEASLFPHLTVQGNVGFACPDRQRVEMLLELFDIGHLTGKKPGQISGGERQRVAFAQALAVQPRLLLLDEPFSALDLASRRRLREKLLVLKKEFTIPMVLVTHDLEEASILGDRLITLERGRTDTGWLDRLQNCLPGQAAPATVTAVC